MSQKAQQAPYFIVAELVEFEKFDADGPPVKKELTLCCGQIW
ncbi:hypothetical protein FOCG_08493 [Fusarium oxysporum f. sp. radicis-lycopersici 26381]|uniref:Uncharacterized protein n=1 Tax=Fusarium oxysporum Fo47 TaxID=660027 RepID=W9JH62_FUSOX|nr:hypothetical protein FOZG_15786 [Fusarium oxysporum Fo47]EXL52714.1 hypothetical protein FOCG_08493 [Fusarium oxysporum f. sp. radicis-lycopersici 26381]